MGRCPTPRQGEVLPAPPARLRCANKHDGIIALKKPSLQASKLPNFYLPLHPQARLRRAKGRRGRTYRTYRTNRTGRRGRLDYGFAGRPVGAVCFLFSVAVEGLALRACTLCSLDVALTIAMSEAGRWRRGILRRGRRRRRRRRGRGGRRQGRRRLRCRGRGPGGRR